jgi:hypothetical protein
VGFLAIWSDTAFFMDGTPPQLESTLTPTIQRQGTPYIET